MSFRLPYVSKGRRTRFIDLPDFYMNFVSAEDVNQLAHGLHSKTNNEPQLNSLRNATISLAKQRRESKHA